MIAYEIPIGKAGFWYHAGSGCIDICLSWVLSSEAIPGACIRGRCDENITPSRSLDVALSFERTPAHAKAVYMHGTADRQDHAPFRMLATPGHTGHRAVAREQYDNWS